MSINAECCFGGGHSELNVRIHLKFEADIVAGIFPVVCQRSQLKFVRILREFFGT